MAGGDLEHLADEAARCPVRHGNLPAGPANAHQLGGGALWTWREHRAIHADDEVKAGIGIGEFFSVALVKLDLHAFP